MSIKLIARRTDNSELTMDALATETIQDLKKRVGREGVVWVYNGVTLMDTKTVSEYTMNDGDLLLESAPKKSLPATSCMKISGNMIMGRVQPWSPESGNVTQTMNNLGLF